MSGNTRRFTANTWVMLVGLALLALVPAITPVVGGPFMLDLVMRAVILAIAAVSLNLILGFGGMISFGHAAYIGIGAKGPARSR